jgi:hypothetical protein
MKTKNWWAGGLLAIGLLALTAASGGQPPDSGVKREAPHDPTPPPGAIQLPRVDPPFATPPAPPAQQTQTIDQLIDSLTDIRAKKVELDKQEQAVITAIRERLKAQRERLNKMGVGEEPAPRADSRPDVPLNLDRSK